MRNHVRNRFVLCAVVGAVLSLGQAGATELQSAAAPDDSAQNKGQKTTAESQSNRKADVDLTAKIRRALIADKGLSVYAHNVKIVTVNGAVTLKGPVDSEAEKQKVVSDAAGVIAPGAITNKLTVK